MGYSERVSRFFARAYSVCYNTYMKNRLISFVLLFVLAFFPGSSLENNVPSIADFVSSIQETLRTNDIEGYLMKFSPEIRKQEGERINSLFNLHKTTDVHLFPTRKGQGDGGVPTVYIQALFQNSHSVVIETWKLRLQPDEGHWQIKEKSISGEAKELYKLRIPDEKIERVHRIEIEHVDIKLTFENALLFYDNIPEFETALLVIGQGTLNFSPSDPQEKHQLEMIFKKRVLEDNLKYAYLRFSDHLFKNNIRIERATASQRSYVSEEEFNEAQSLFTKHYRRSFTIENSLNGELLSFLPSGEEAVFEFEGNRIGTYSYIFSPFSEEEVNLFQWKEDKVISMYSPQEENKKKRMYLSFGRMTDIKNYEIDIAFEPKDSYISGKAKIHLSSQVAYLDGIKLKFNPALEILRIYDEERRELFYTQDRLRKYIYVYFIQQPERGEEVSIEVFYRGKLIPPHQTSDVIAGPQVVEEVFINTPIRYETWLYTQSAYWYPSPPDDDYFQARLKIICPPDFTCVANGEMIEQYTLNGMERVEDIEKMGNLAFVFQTKYPVKYMSFIVGKLKEAEEEFSLLPLKLYKSSYLRNQKKGLLQEAKEIIRFYEDKFGRFPYGKLSIIHRVWRRSGGHSPASFIVLNEMPVNPSSRRFINRNSPVDFSRWKEYFLAHEIAHQWWGQGMTWKTYHDQWLSEGLAQFSSLLYLADKYGDKILSSVFKQLSSWTKDKSEWGAITLGSRISYFDYDAFQSIVYNKACLVLNLLKDYLGDELFFEGLKTFFSEHKYGAAGTNDFTRVFERVSEQNLGLFFEGWLNSHLLPEVKAEHSYRKEGDRYLLEFVIRQQKKSFAFPLWVEWSQNGQKVTKKLIIDDKVKQFKFDLEDKPRKIKVNPRKAVPGQFK